MENAAPVSLKGNTAQRDLGSCFILKAGFFFIKWINLALLPARDSEPSGRVGRFYPVFPALCDTGAWKHLPTRARAGPAEKLGDMQEGKGSSPWSGQQLQHSRAPTCLGTQKWNYCLWKGERAGNSLSLKKDTQILSFPFLSLFFGRHFGNPVIICVIYLLHWTAQGPAFHLIDYFDIFTHSFVCLSSIPIKTSNFKLIRGDWDFSCLQLNSLLTHSPLSGF